MPDYDYSAPARGILNGLGIALIFWAVMAAIVLGALWATGVL